MTKTKIAQVEYRAKAGAQTACIYIAKDTAPAKDGKGFTVAAHIGGEDDGPFPAWLERAGTEQAARAIGNAWHKQLETQYGMKRVR